MTEPEFLEQFINKQVDFRFFGKTVQFDLSQSLFSSNDVDDGSRLLLKTVAKEIGLETVDSLLDIGCGVGVLGISLKKQKPAMTVDFQDRDALALAVTKRNAELNQIGAVGFRQGLALEGLDDRRYDLIVSNLPGKAGPPVLQHILNSLPHHLTADGVAAVVIVKPLSDLVEQTLQENGSEVLFKEHRRGYTVFHFKPVPAADRPDIDPLLPYSRGAFPFKMGKLSITLNAVFNVDEFDTLGFNTKLVLNLLKSRPVRGECLFWNPGQGHLPVYFARRYGTEISKYVLAGRDLLSLRNARANLLALGVADEAIELAHLPHFLALGGQYDAVVLFPDVDPGVPWPKVLLPASAGLLKPGGQLFLVAKSSFMHRLLSASHGLKTVIDRKRHGLRAVLLSK